MNRHLRISSQAPHKLQQAGIDIVPILRRAGLSPGLFDEPRVLVSTEELFDFWNALGELSPDPAIGVVLGTENRIEHLSPTALAALSSPDFGSAVQQVARYKRLTCPEEILQKQSDNEWGLQFRWTMATSPEPRVLVDVCFAWVLSVARLGTGTRITPLRLELREPRSYVKELERHFGCPVLTGAEQNTIFFRSSDAARPLVTRNAELLATLAPQLEAELARQSAADEAFTDSVRREIQQKLTGRRPSIQDVARSLHISSRTLQRRLQESGSSFQHVLEEARHCLARHYLNNSVLELNEAAYLLGYEDANSFVRAFRAWEGVPPGRWREMQRQQAAAV